MLMHPAVQRIEHWPLERLIPYARNSRTHSDAQVAQIADGIAEFGFNDPILVDTNAGIIADRGRQLAARKLQLHEVSVIVLDHLSATSNQPFTDDLRERCRPAVSALHAVGGTAAFGLTDVTGGVPKNLLRVWARNWDFSFWSCHWSNVL